LHRDWLRNQKKGNPAEQKTRLPKTAPVEKIVDYFGEYCPGLLFFSLANPYSFLVQETSPYLSVRNP
jgi:hypothetical protein